MQPMKATETSLKCETCIAEGTTCSGERQICHDSQDACISSVTEYTRGKVTTVTTMKSCSTKSACGLLKPGVRGSSGRLGNFIKKIQCSKATASSGSFLLALSGFLLQNLLF
ncbi:phospholipase A2 inhibitor gamma subunit B-like isoform X2 [Eublepharis macularius]|uniref:Phospholipase A2 inhibitor gamma subunit B-like isoform X2 n=1 Tax=Eublepharis macularius TaxID=481883 RepID=A0AA97KIJ2_EUBMA|nr:phospholipase A2 inhibitor gamma subunit B-like isoform X2 [Eublepharis macularius]